MPVLGQNIDTKQSEGPQE